MGIFDFAKTENPILGTIGTIIGSDTTIKGDIISKGSVRVDGAIEGDISSEGEIFVSGSAKLKGRVSGKRIVVAGEITGDVVSFESIELKKTGKIFGNISGDKLVVDHGAYYKGRVAMGEAKNEKEESGQLSEKIKEAIGL